MVSGSAASGRTHGRDHGSNTPGNRWKHSPTWTHKRGSHFTSMRSVAYLRETSRRFRGSFASRATSSLMSSILPSGEPTREAYHRRDERADQVRDPVRPHDG